MTRRERHLAILKRFDHRQQRDALRAVKDRAGAEVYTDEAIEAFARQVLSDYQFNQKLNAENRRRSMEAA